MLFWMVSELGPNNSMLRGVTIPEGQGAVLGGQHVPMCPTNLTPYELRIGLVRQRRSHDRGRRLIAIVRRVYYLPLRGWNCTPRAKSDIYDCLVCCVILFLRKIGGAYGCAVYGPQSHGVQGVS